MWVDAPLRSDLVLRILYLVFSITVPLVAWRWVFSIPLRSALVCPIMFGPPFRTGSPPYTVGHVATDFLLIVALFTSLLLIPFWSRFSCATRLATFWRATPRRWRRIVLVVVLPVFALTFHFIRYDGALNWLVACRRLYKHEQWDALLEQARQNPYGDPGVQFMTNFALCRERRLLDEMFSYAQVWGPRGLVFNFFNVDVPPAEDDSYRAMYNSDLFYEMGYMRGHPAKPFLQLLESKSDNPMAFDYLMAWILLDKSSMVGISRSIDQFESAGYTSLPIHCQEALLLLERVQGEAIDLQGFRYDEATVARVEEFFRYASRLQGREDALLQMEGLYGDTYMFYYFFLGPPPDARRQAPRGSRGVSRDE